MNKLISEVEVGMTLMEGGKVTKIEPCPSSKGTKTHINGKDCWENFSEVRVQN